MTIAPIINAKVASGNVNFQGRNKKQQQTSNEISPSSNKASSMVTVPVAVLMALATTSLNANPANSKAPAESEIQTELVAQSTSQAEAPQQKTQTPYKKNKNYEKDLNFSSNLITFDVINRKNTLKPDKRAFTLAFREFGENTVGSISVIPFDKKSNQFMEDAYHVNALVVHKPLEGYPFYGVIVSGYDENEKVTKFELSIPKKVGDAIYNLVKGKSPYKNRTQIEYITTEKASLMSDNALEIENSIYNFW